MMEQTIRTLCNIVAGSSEKDADSAISKAFPKISSISAINVRKDIQDFLDKEMSESELRYYLSEAGI